METGHITIKENNKHQLVVEAKLIDGTLWMTKYEITELFNVFVNTIGNNLRSIFKSGVLREENITRVHKYKSKGRQYEMTLYNLEALIFVSYRISSYEARAFREWVMKALTEFTRAKPKNNVEVVIVYNVASQHSAVMLN